MAFFTNSSIIGCGTSYNPEKHDLYLYDREPSIDNIFVQTSTNIFYSQTSAVVIAYNTKNYMLSAPYNIDVSGVVLRPKSFGNNSSSQFSLFSNKPDSTECPIAPFDSTEDLSFVNNIAYWNAGTYNGVLITPKHIAITSHYIGSPPNFLLLKFLTKDNRIVETRSDAIYNGFGLPSDTTIMEIKEVVGTTNTDLQHEIDAGNLTCYREYIDIDATTSGIINTTNKFDRAIGFRIDGNNRIVRGLLNKPGTIGIQRYSVDPYISPTIYLQNGDIDQYQPESNDYWTGDSGSPCFVYDKITNKTIFVGGQYGFNLNHVFTPEINSLLTAAGYPPIKLSPNQVDLMTLSDWSGLYVNNSGSSLNLPEYLGKIVVKNEVGSQQFVKTLYKNDGDGSASIIWDTTTPVVPEPTDIPTDIPIDIPTDIPTEIVAPTGACCLDPSPDGFTCIQTTQAECLAVNGTYKGDGTFCTNETCTICGTCNTNDPVLYPTVGSPLVSPPNDLVVNCSVWTNCGNIYNLTQNNTLNQYLDDPDTPGQIYARIYDLPSDTSTHLPPPLGYVMTDMATYTVKDRIVVYFNNQIIEQAQTFSNVSSLVNQNEYLLPNTSNTNFNTDHLGETRYNLYCGGPRYNLTDFGFCTNPDILSDEYLCACQVRCDTEPCTDIYGGVQILPTGQDPTNCIGIDSIGTKNIILDTGCVATNSNCPTVCYGTPIPPLQTDNSEDIKEYHCRSVGKVNPVIFSSFGQFSTQAGSDSLITTNSALDGYNGGYKFGDIGIINDSGCDRDQCTGDPCPCSSAWKIRIFLPFYLNVPSLRYGSNGNPFDSNTDIRGKYVVFTKTDLRLGVVQQYPTLYNQHPLLKNLYDLIKGFIRSSGISISSPYDYLSDNMRDDKMVWVGREIPRQINNTIASHTHQVVLELTTATDRCSLCVNTAGISGATYDISAIRLYPITTPAGRLVANSPLRLMVELAGHSGGIGLRSLNSARYYYHPSADPQNSGAGNIYPSKLTSFTLQQEEIADNNNCVYIDTITGTNFTSWGQYGNNTNTSFSTGDIFPWNLYEILNLWNQKAFTNTISTNCDCTVLG